MGLGCLGSVREMFEKVHVLYFFGIICWNIALSSVVVHKLGLGCLEASGKYLRTVHVPFLFINVGIPRVPNVTTDDDAR